MGRTLKPLLAVAAAFLVLPATAGASATLSPSGHDFGQVPLGSNVTKTFMLVTLCDDDPLVIGYTCEPQPDPPLDVEIGVTGGFTQANNCPASMPRDQAVVTSCTIWVSYSPSAFGWSSGGITTGNALAGAPASWVAANGVAARSGKKKGCKKAKKRSARAKCLKRKRARRR